MKLYRQKLYSDLERDIVKQFLGRLSGFVHKAKSLHWAAEGKDIHEYLDGIWEETYKFQDAIAEGYMGIDGKLDSDVPFLMPEATSPEEFISELEEKVEEFYSQLPDLAKFKGLSGEIESFVQTVEKYKYLFSLCNNDSSNEQKEFSKKEKKGKETAAVIGGSAGLLGSGLIIKKKGDRLAYEGIKAVDKEAIPELVKLGKNEILHPKSFEVGTGDGIMLSLDGMKKYTDLKKKISDGVRKIEKGDTKSKVGKGLLIAGAALPAAYVIHRKKIKKREKKADLEKLENGKMTKAEFVEKYKV